MTVGILCIDDLYTCNIRCTTVSQISPGRRLAICGIQIDSENMWLTKEYDMYVLTTKQCAQVRSTTLQLINCFIRPKLESKDLQLLQGLRWGLDPNNGPIGLGNYPLPPGISSYSQRIAEESISAVRDYMIPFSNVDFSRFKVGELAWRGIELNDVMD